MFNYSLRDRDNSIHVIEHVRSETDLGVTVDYKLSFEEHIDKIVKRGYGILATE